MVTFIIFVVNKSAGQSSDNIFSFDYTMAPITTDDIAFNRTDFEISLPVKLKKGLLINTVSADFYQFSYTKDYSFSTTDLSRFNFISYGLKYTHSLSNTWRLNSEAKASIASNLINNISYHDLLFMGEVSITKVFDKDKQEALTVGVNYSVITGKPKILPTINYSKQVNEKFSYGIGFPKTFAGYRLTNLSTLSSSLSLDGFYSNLTTPISVSYSEYATKASFSSTSLALEYSYKMDDYWSILFKGAYAFSNTYKLFNSNDNTIFDFNAKSKPFFSAGIKFNLKTK